MKPIIRPANEPKNIPAPESTYLFARRSRAGEATMVLWKKRKEGASGARELCLEEKAVPKLCTEGPAKWVSRPNSLTALEGAAAIRRLEGRREISKAVVVGCGSTATVVTKAGSLLDLLIGASALLLFLAFH